MTTDLDTFIAEAMKANPIEAKVIRKIIRTLKKAGDRVVAVWDGVEEVPAVSEHDILSLVFNLDYAHLYTESGGWVFVVMGNEWDVLSDYTLSLEDKLKPVNDWIEENWD